MKKLLVLMMILMFTLVFFGCGKAKEGATGFAEKTYSATMVTTGPGMPQAATSKFYKDADKTRTETNTGAGFTMVNIVRQDKKVVWMVIPENKAYTEQPLTEEQAKKGEIYKEGQTVKIGEETMDGHPCVKYEITTASQPDAKTIQWLAKDLRNFPIRMEHQMKGKTQSVTQFKDISFNKPAAELFEVPKDCKKVASMQEAMMGGKPMKPKSTSPKRRRG